jgi:asparagine synthase (glutamine-hydrolysing)
MGGIAGIIGSKAGEERRTQLEAMVRCIRHERSYASGTYVNEQLGLWVGWVAQPGSVSDGAPVWNKAQDVGLIFSGEDYSSASEITGSVNGEHVGEPHGPSGLVGRYEEIGLPMLEELNGWFSGLFVDLRRRKVMLFNDRYGIGRIYYHEAKDGLYFSTEAKSLLKVLPALRQLDYRSLGEFFSCGCALQNRTLFSGISLFPCGSVWTYSSENGERLRKEAYFRPEQWEAQTPLTEAEYYTKLKETWARALPRYFRSRGPLALSLTGGVDSRMILAWMDRPPGSLPCYTFGGRYRDCVDVKVAREVARITGQPHEVIPVDGEFMKDFPALAEKSVYLSDGAMDVSGSIDLYVQRLARDIAPIRVTGTNGGEIMRQLVVFKPMMNPCQDVLDPELASHVKVASQTYAEELEGHRLSFTAFKQAPWYMCSKFILERSQLALRMPYFDNDLVALVYRVPPALAESQELALRLIAEGNPALERVGTDRGLRTQAIPALGRAHHLFQQFTFKAEYAYDIGMPQWLARLDHSLAPLHLEKLFLGRHKFHHFRVYYRDELSPYLKEMLLDPQTLGRPLFRKSVLEAMIQGHVGGYRNHTLEIHKLLTIELILRKLIELN